MLPRLRDCDRLLALFVLASSDDDAESPPTPALAGVALESRGFLCRDKDREAVEAAPTAPGLPSKISISLGGCLKVGDTY